jgi:hypothetical protein
MLLPVPGATAARVTPALRLTAMAVVRGLIAGATSMAALNGELAAEMSLVASTAFTSTSPTREKPLTMPGVTQRPVASTRCALAGTATSRPAATIRPSRTSTVPPWIGSEPSPNAIVPPVMAMVCAASGLAATISVANAAPLRIEARITSHPLHPAGRARNR